jgi:hypothetical protein
MMGATISADSVFDDRLTGLEPRIRSKYFLLADQCQALRDGARMATVAWETEHQKLVAARGAHVEAVALEKRDPDVLAARRAGSYRKGRRLEAAEARLVLCEERSRGKIIERDRIAQVAADAGAVLDAITGLIGDTNPAELVPILVARGTSPNPAGDIERVRQTLANVAREEVTLRHAPVPLTEATVALDAHLDRISQDFDPIRPALCVAQPDPGACPGRPRALPLGAALGVDGAVS